MPETRKRNKADSIERYSKPRWVIKTVHQELGDEEEVRRGHKELGGQGGDSTLEGLNPKDLKPS